MSVNDLLFNDAEDLLFPEVFPIEPPLLMPSFRDINTLNSQLGRLSFEVNTQSL